MKTSRYARQISMSEVGAEGQQKLAESSVLAIGLGGLGSPASIYLAAAGVGRIGLIDDDVVDISNLHRQILYASAEAGRAKVECGAQRLQALNPEIAIETYPERLTCKNALELFAKYDFILDGADNFATRYLVNDAAYFARRPLISASVLGFEGQLSVFDAAHGPCYRCLYPEPPPQGSVPSCAEAGVLGTMPGLLGLLQANEVLKLILQIGEPLHSRLLLCNGLNLEFTVLQTGRNPQCPLCGTKTIKELREEHFVCSSDAEIPQISSDELRARLKNQNFQLLDVREDSEFAEGKLPFTHHIPLNRLEQEFDKLSLETPVIIYCRSGGRSLKACQILKQKGYSVTNLKGGIREFFKK